MFAPVMYVFGESVEVFAAKSLALAEPPISVPDCKVRQNTYEPQHGCLG